MRLHVRLALIAWLIALFVMPVHAFAWSNGPDGGDSFGTHDWILYQALTLARPAWVDTQTALFATDDPDSTFPASDKPNHMFLPSGAYRGGPDTVATMYRQLLDAHQAHDDEAASRYLGWLAHYYGDLCVPFHTMTGYSDSALHLQYELKVNSLTTTPGACADWITVWSRSAVNDIRVRAIDAAMLSRSAYPTLATDFMLSGWDETSQMITRMMLSRAVNDLADVISSVPRGSGLPTPVALTTTMTHRYPAVDSATAYTATCLDPDLRPAEGVRVRFEWEYPSTSRTVDLFTDVNGVARAYADPSLLVMGGRVNVAASLPATQGAATSSIVRRSWFIPTDRIGYTATTISSGYPAPDQLITATTVVLNPTGAPVVGLPVTFTWDFKSNVYSRTVSTDNQGTARNTRNVGTATTGYRVTVRANMEGGGVSRSSSASFVPQNTIASMTSVVSTSAPAPNSKVTVSTTCLDPLGRPIAGAPVDFLWRFRSAALLSTAYTNSAGIARSTRDIKRATRGYPVPVGSSTKSGSGNKTSMTWFIPR